MELSFPVPNESEIVGHFYPKWFDFVSRFRYRQRQKGERKTSFLLHFGANIVKQIQETHQLSWEEMRKFSSFIETLEHRCLFQIALSFSRYLFFNHSRETGLETEDYYKELKLLSDLCSFDEEASDGFMKDLLVKNIQEEGVKDLLLSGGTLSAKDVVKICSQIGQQDSDWTIQDRPSIQEVVLGFLKDKQQKSSCNSINNGLHDDEGNSAFHESTLPTEVKENLSRPNFVFMPDHQYTSNIIGNYIPAEEEEEKYEAYAVEIFEPMESPTYVASNIMSKNKSTTALTVQEPLQVVSGSSKLMQPLKPLINDLLHQSEPAGVPCVPPTPPPLSMRPCVSVYRNKKSTNTKLRRVQTTNKVVGTDSEDKAKETLDAATNFLASADDTIQTTAGISDSTYPPTTNMLEEVNANNFDTIFITMSDPIDGSTEFIHADSDEKKIMFPSNHFTVAVAEDVNEILYPNYCSQQEVELNTTRSQGGNQDASVTIDPFSTLEVEDINDIPQWCCSKQKAVLKTSQIKESTGQSVDVYSCNFCIYSSTGNDDMEEHALRHHRSLKCFVCTICNAKFPHEEQFGSHFRTQHLDVEEYKCQTCDMVFDCQTKLFSHMESHVEPVSCRVCGSTFSTEKLLSDHMVNVHPEANRWCCHICSSSFVTRKSLSDHLCKVHKDRDRTKELDRTHRFTCKECGINFSDKKSADMHKRKFHWKPKAKHFHCDICPYTCATRHKLTSHRRIHTGEKPFICEVCGKGFAQFSALTSHNRYHTGEKPYKCQYCSHAYFTSSGRLAHERKHRNERPYVCEQCSKTFRNSTELKMHIETHNEFRTKRFQCQCGAAFDTRRNLKRHAVRHSGVKAYKCDICGASFTHPENVTGHQKSGACRNRMLKMMKLKD